MDAHLTPGVMEELHEQFNRAWKAETVDCLLLIPTEQARARAGYYLNRKEQGGGTTERLVPLLAGLLKRLPWLKQWHTGVDPEYGLGMGDYFADFVNEEARAQGLAADAIRVWSPPAKAGKRRDRKPKQQKLVCGGRQS